MLGERGGSGIHKFAIKRRERDDSEVIFVGRRFNLVAGRHVALELFDDLASQRFARGLAGLDLAAGKLPHAAQCAIRAALGTEHFAIAHDDGTHDIDLLLHAAPLPTPPA